MKVNLDRMIRKAVYFKAHHWVGIEIEKEYEILLKEDREACSISIMRQRLKQILEHSRKNVPYYARLMESRGNSYQEDPEGYLANLPILTKDLLREHFEELQSQDLSTRKWKYNSSGGSTGEPARFIQDNDFYARIGAIQWLSHDWAGRKFAEPGIRVWGSDIDVQQGTMGWKMNLINTLTNDIWFNAYHMTPGRMRACLQLLNEQPPKLISAYAQSIFELAQFAEEEGIEVKPQAAIMTTANTLFPFMRQKIEQVFQCEVFNRYGSREVGDIACECEQHQGMHVFPWGNYLEIVDDQGQVVPAGVEGNIVVTSLNNYAMPLIRYLIGDRGVLSEKTSCACGRGGQILEHMSGRTLDTFLTKDGTYVNGSYFTTILFLKDWIKKFQVIQTDFLTVVFKIVKRKEYVPTEDIEDIVDKTKVAMGEDCQVIFEYVEEIPPLSSGKYCYVISRVENPLLKEGRLLNKKERLWEFKAK